MIRNFEKGDFVTWHDHELYGDGIVLGMSTAEPDRCNVRFESWGYADDYEDSEYEGNLDYHSIRPAELRPKRTLAEKRQDDFKVLEAASRPWRNAPDYYKFPHDVQTTDISMHLNSNGGQAVGYISRSTRIDGQNKEDDPRESLRKAIDLIQMEIYRLDEKFGDAE